MSGKEKTTAIQSMISTVMLLRFIEICSCLLEYVCAVHRNQQIDEVKFISRNSVATHP